MRVWSVTCMRSLPRRPDRPAAGDRQPAREPAAGRGAAGGSLCRNELPAGDLADLGLVDAHAGVVEGEVAEQPVVLRRADRVGELLAALAAGRLERGEEDDGAVVRLGAVHLRRLAVRLLVLG